MNKCIVHKTFIFVVAIDLDSMTSSKKVIDFSQKNIYNIHKVIMNWVYLCLSA
jgi:hypothetical protein